MPEGNTHAAGFRAQCAFGALRKLGDFLDRRPHFRMRAQFFLFSFGVFTANEFLVLLSHNMLLIWESALLASCCDLSIISLAKFTVLSATARTYSMIAARTISDIVAASP